MQTSNATERSLAAPGGPRPAGSFTVLPAPDPVVTPPTPPDPAPTITSADPMKVGPGKWVTVRGSGFDAVPAATFGGLPVDPAGVRRIGPDHLEVRVPVLARKSAAFQLVFGAGTVASPTLTLRFGKPVVTGITPRVGRVGDRVEITGTNLASATKIYFGAAPTKGFEVHLDPERLWVVVPPRAETGPVQVKTRGSKELAGLAGASSAIFRVQPVIASILPPSAPPGARVTLVGSGLYLPIGDLGVAGQWTRPLEISPDPTVSNVFWSLVQDVSCPWRPGRAVATLHLLLTDAERQAFDEVIHREDTAFLFPGSTPPPPLTFGRLLEALHADPVLVGTPAFRSLAALVSPRIFMATPGAVTTAGFHRFTVTGSGFLGAVGVTVDGVAAGDLHVIDDVRLEVTIPDSPTAVPRVLRVIRVPEVVEGVLTI